MPLQIASLLTLSLSNSANASSHHLCPSGTFLQPPLSSSRISFPEPDRNLVMSSHRTLSGDEAQPAVARTSAGGTVMRPILTHISFIATQCRISSGPSSQIEDKPSLGCAADAMGVVVPETSTEAGVCNSTFGEAFEDDSACVDSARAFFAPSIRPRVLSLVSEGDFLLTKREMT